MSSPKAFPDCRKTRDGSERVNMKFEKMNRDGSRASSTFQWTLMSLAALVLLTSVAIGAILLIQTRADIEDIKAENGKLKQLLQELFNKKLNQSATGTEQPAANDGFQQYASSITAMVDMSKERRIRAATQDQSQELAEVKDKVDITAEILRLRVRNSCTVFYEKKCFIPIIKELKRHEAEKICAGLGGHMANIYSKSHYNEVLRHIPTVSMEMQIREIILGMSYDSRTGRLYRWDGSPAKFKKWLSRRWPFKDPSYTQMNIRVNEDEEATHLGMFNTDPATHNADGVLCEI